MQKTEQPIFRHRALWISDLHLGSPGCKARELVQFLRQNEARQLYLVGDIFDGWKMKSRFYWTADHTRVIKAIIAKARRGTKVYYLTGNHDDFMRQFVRRRLRLGRIRIAHEVVHTTVEGRRLLVRHGDQYDAVVRSSPALALAGDVAYEALMKLTDVTHAVADRFGLPHWSPSAFAKHKVKSLVQYLSGFDDQVYYECKRRGFNGVICGHTHHAEARHVKNGVVSYNTGDWVESCTALAEDFRGHMEILRFGTPEYAARPAQGLKLVKGKPETARMRPTANDASADESGTAAEKSAA
ncbi:MAG TPA: UDP-2,3-diacylglucosamine diphosphatase [Solimonas sp.]|nr:UDP-2,3-diacylglucosamine diphosphatase [Solimonas sp.]